MKNSGPKKSKSKRFVLVVQIERKKAGTFTLAATGRYESGSALYAADLFALSKKNKKVHADMEFQMAHRREIAAMVASSIATLLEHGVEQKPKKKK